MSKGKKAFKVIGFIFESLIGLYIILYIIFSIQLHNEFAQLKAKGMPITIAEIVPAPVPDEENAAILYNKAFVLMTTGEGGKPYILNEKVGYEKVGWAENEAVKTIKDVKSFSDISEWTDEQRNKVPQLVNSSQLRDIYALLEEGSSKPKCNFNLNYDKGMTMSLMHLSIIRDAVRSMCVKALLEADSGKTEQAADTLLAGLKISNHLKDEPVLITQLVRVACDRIIIGCIEGIADSKGLPPEKANLLMYELSLHQGEEPFIKCMEGERILCGEWAFERLLRGTPKALKELGYYNPFSAASVVILRKPILKKDFVCYLTFMSKMQDSYNIPYYEIAKNFNNEITKEDIPKYCVLTRSLLPALSKVREQAASHQADIDVCRTGLALKLYKAENGSYPEKLDSLAPKFLGEVPVDPFSGESLKYSNYGESFKLYSIGPNMQDDFGTEKTHEKDSPAFEDYDIVWQSQIQLNRNE